MVTGRNYKFWFCTGSQDLYGDECFVRLLMRLMQTMNVQV